MVQYTNHKASKVNTVKQELRRVPIFGVDPSAF
jgi:hypothetical protein